jgi:predicted amidophosphoribosyltransferase
MDEKNEKYLKPIKEICEKIENSNSQTSCCDELHVYIKKAPFYALHSFRMLLEILKKKVQKLPVQKAREISKTLNFIIQTDEASRKNNLISLYNFILSDQVS